MKNYPHQDKFLADNPNKALLAWDTGTGKTYASIMWIKARPNQNFLIIVPKNIKGKWLKDVEDYKLNALRITVLTKEEYKKQNCTAIDGIVVDEADFFGSALFMPGRSKLAEKLYSDIRNNNIKHVLLMTATPFKSAPHTIHTLLSYIGNGPLWKDWQRATYDLKMLPYLPRPAYIPNKGWRFYALDYAKPRMYTAKISDIATVPTQHNDVIEIKTNKPTEILSDNPTSEWHEYARAENGKEKLDWIKDYIRGKSKVVIVCRYKEQIATYAKELQKDREVFILTGDTKNQDEEIRLAKESFECVFLIQAGIGAGFQLAEKKSEYYNFSHMIFASMSFSHRDYVQMQGRILRGDALQENWYTYLIGGACDKSVHKRVMLGEDFKL